MAKSRKRRGRRPHHSRDLRLWRQERLFYQVRDHVQWQAFQLGTVLLSTGGSYFRIFQMLVNIHHFGPQFLIYLQISQSDAILKTNYTDDTWRKIPEIVLSKVVS
jgi:hypothetical protein